MSATTTAAFLTVVLLVVGGYVASIWMLVGRIDRRLEAIEKEIKELRTDVARIGQRLEDHIENHPGPTQRIAR